MWYYLYRAIDSDGNTIDWMLSKDRSEEAAEKFFRQVLENDHCEQPRVVSVDKHASYPPAFNTMKTEELISSEAKLRLIKYLNNIIEQDHRFLKRRIRYSLWLQHFETAEATILGYESMHMLRKGQVKGVGRNDIVSQKIFIDRMFGVAA